jgi:predicted methyltransferase
MKRLAIFLACAAACATAPRQPSQDEKPDLLAARIVDSPDRSEADRKLDPGRHPKEMLRFLGARKGMKVLEVGAGPGYTTELIARAVSPGGVVYMQNDPRWLPFLEDALADRFTHPAMQGVARADVPFDDPVPPDARDLDLVVMNVIYHDVVNMPVDRARMNQAIFDALRPGGAYIVIDSSAKDGTGIADTKTLHRIDESVVRDEVQRAGFRLESESEFLRNPADARDWNASPQAAEKAGKRGTSDRFALRFVKPAG